MTESDNVQKSILGPVLAATLTTSHVDECVAAWCNFLHQSVFSESRLSDQDASDWQRPSLAGARQVWLQNEVGEAWLRIIEDDKAEALDPFAHSGWLSLEINVMDVDALHQQLLNSPFSIIGAPADLDISSDIRAMQVIGPAGEVLYLTEIKKPVAGFDLPLARCPVDKIFIPVLLSESRASSLADYEQFPGTIGNPFDTRITVINRARRLPIETRHPIATVQLSGQSLIEIDQLNELKTRPEGSTGLPAGISVISFLLSSLDALPDRAARYQPQKGPFADSLAFLFKGSAGELIELVYDDQTSKTQV